LGWFATDDYILAKTEGVKGRRGDGLLRTTSVDRGEENN